MELDQGSRDELVQQFRDITGVDSSESSHQIVDLLTVNSWNLNNSISVYFDTGFELVELAGGVSPVEGVAASSGAASGVEEYETGGLNHRGDNRNVVNLQNQMFFDNYIPKLPKAPKLSSIWQMEVGIQMSVQDNTVKDEKVLDEKNGLQVSNERTSSGSSSPLWIILLFIPKSLLSILVSIFKFFFGGAYKKINLNNFPRKFNYIGYNPKNEIEYEELKQASDGNAKAESIVCNEFNDLHSKCQSKYSWLLVILTNNDTKSNEFVQSFMSSPSFQNFSDTEIFINNCERSREAFEIGETYKVKKLPYVMLIGNVTNNPSIMSSMSVVYKSNISSISLETSEITRLTVKKIYKGLHKVMEHYSPQLITQRIDQHEIEFSRMIKEQQDAAYIESLARDKQRKQEREMNAKKQEDEEALKKLRRNFLQSRLKSGWIDNNLLGEKGEDSVRMAIKLPKGERIIEIFKRLISTEELYLYVELKLYSNEVESEDEDVEKAKENEDEEKLIDLELSDYINQFSFKFELIQPFPKKSYLLIKFKLIKYQN